MRAFSFLLLAFLANALPAQQLPPQDEPPTADALVETEEEIRRYSVEVIVFEYNDGTAVPGEVFSPDEAAPVEEPVVEEILLPDYRGRLRAWRDFENSELLEIQLNGPVDLFLLPPEEFALTDAYRRLQRLDAYTPLMHGGWVQTTAAPGDAPAIRLRRLGNPPLKLDGSLTLYLSRYLHLVVDLALHAGEVAAVESLGPESGEAVPYYGDSQYADDASPNDPFAMRRPIFFRINEDRIFRNGDLRYFDHPRFGMLAKVSRYELVETESVIETDEDVLLPAPPGSP